MNYLLTILIAIIIIFYLFVNLPHILEGPNTDVPKAKIVKPKMAIVESAIEIFYTNTGKYPERLEDLIDSPENLEGLWKGPYLEKKSLFDPWDRPFIYEINPSDSNEYKLISYGKDGKPGGEGYNADIYNE